MSTLPHKSIVDLVDKAERNDGKMVKGNNGWRLEAHNGDLFLDRYGIPIFEIRAGTPYIRGGAYSQSDRNTINSILIYKGYTCRAKMTESGMKWNE